MVRVCSIEANISCGKTTLIKRIMERVNQTDDGERYILVDEPTAEWEKIIDSSGKGILHAFYDNQDSIALPFQFIALITRRQKIMEKLKEAEELEKKINMGVANDEKKEVIILTERTIHSDYYIFAKMLSAQGKINEHGLIAYKLWYDIFCKEVEINKFVYININPDTCYSRVKVRSREGEDKITLEYLTQCQNAHDAFFEKFISKTDHLIIDNTDIHKDSEEYEGMVDDVISYLNRA